MRASSDANTKQITVKKMLDFGSASKEMPLNCWFEDACVLDMDYFVKTLSGIKAKGVQPDLIGSIITHYASKWLPDLHPDSAAKTTNNSGHRSPENPTVSLMKKRFLVETLVSVLPPEVDAVPCSFMLRLLRSANLVGAEPGYRAELEKRIGHHLDQASLEDLLIPAFSHTCGTLLDVSLVLRLVKRFLSLEEGIKNGTALVKVAKLTDSYLAEVAIDSGLTVQEFEALAGALPFHARMTDDGLYRAVDTYLKAHPGVSKSERKRMCRLIDCRKLSLDACLHAAQNERLPVRTVIQVLLCEQAKINRHVNCSASFNGLSLSPGLGLDAPTRCQSKREAVAAGIYDARFMYSEIRRVKEEMMKLQAEFETMQVQVEKLVKKKSFFFPWRKSSSKGGGRGGMLMERIDESSSCGGRGHEFETQGATVGTPKGSSCDSKGTRGTLASKASKIRNSLSL
ncbi:root phototropism protein 3-like [Nymphaea colorata]|nr:root phototropism protein 3-like [Nymphaea colorata]